MNDVEEIITVRLNDVVAYTSNVLDNTTKQNFSIRVPIDKFMKSVYNNSVVLY